MAYVTSLDAEHDALPRVGDRCDLQYQVETTLYGPGPLVGRMWCNGRELPPQGRGR